MVMLGALLLLALLKVAVDSSDQESKWPRGSPVPIPGGGAPPGGSSKLGSGCAESSACLKPIALGRPGGDWMGLGETEAPAG